jgi:hypothetical protein
MVYILEASVTGNSHGKTGGPIAKGEHIDEGETGNKGWSTRGVGENQRPELN